MCAERGAPCDPLQVPQPSLKHAGPWPSPPLIRLRTLVHTPTQYDESRATPSPRSIYTLRSCNIPPKPNNHTLVVSLWHRGDCDCWPPIARLEDAAGAVLLGLHARLARLCGHLVGHLELQGIREVSQGFRRHTGCAGALRTGCSDSECSGAQHCAAFAGGRLQCCSCPWRSSCSGSSSSSTREARGHEAPRPYTCRGAGSHDTT